jgi:hypothetical protein
LDVANLKIGFGNISSYPANNLLLGKPVKIAMVDFISAIIYRGTENWNRKRYEPPVPDMYDGTPQ